MFEQITNLFGRSIDDSLFQVLVENCNEIPVYGMGVFSFASSGFCLYVEKGIFKACIFQIKEHSSGLDNSLGFPITVTNADDRVSIIRKLGDPILSEMTQGKGIYPVTFRDEFQLDGFRFNFTFVGEEESIKSVSVCPDEDPWFNDGCCST